MEQYSERSGFTLRQLNATSNPVVDYSQRWPHTLLEMNFGYCTMNIVDIFPHILPCPWISGFCSLQLTFFFISTPDLFTAGFKRNQLGNRTFFLQVKENN